MKYRNSVYEEVKEYYKNCDIDITNEEIDKLDNEFVLKVWLEWQGIFGYTRDIIEIMKAGK